MPEVTPIRDLKAYLEPEQVERLIAATTNSRDALLVRIPSTLALGFNSASMFV